MRIFTLAFLTLGLLSLAYHPLRATHAMGADITYTHLSGNTYQVTLRFYRDCNGVTPLTQVILNVSSVTCSQAFSMTANLAQGYPIEVSPLCPSQLSNSACQGGSLPGVQQYLYQGNVTLPAACRDWTFSFNEGFRNNAITTIDKPGSTYLYVVTKLNNVDAPGNSSPTFTSIPTPYVCINQPYLYNHGAVDPEGDSLVYSLANALNNNGFSVVYLNSFSGTNPLTSSPAVSIDATNGNLTMNPQALQITVLAVVVEEYRNGVLIGSVTRDMQVTVLSCNNNTPSIGNVSNLSGGVLTGSRVIEVCPNTPVSFSIPGIDLDSGDSLFMSWNQGVFGGTFTSNPGTSPASATFSWTPSAANIGTNSFVVTLLDNACPIIGRQAVSFDIVVRERTTAGPDQVVCGGLGAVPLTVNGGTSFSWRVLSGDTGSLSCTNCTSPMASPNQTTTYEVQSNFPCAPRDTVTVNVIPGFSLNLSSDTVICSGGNIGLSATPSVAGTYNYTWTPALSLTNPTTSNPIAAPSTTQTYRVEVSAGSGCSAVDSIEVTVVNSDLSAAPSSSATQYCAGEPVSLFANVAAASCDVYAVQNVPFSPVTGIGTSVSLADDAMSGALPIGFSFNFYCNDYTTFFLSSNGWLSFQSQSSSYYQTNPVPTSGQPNSLIAFGWDDLDPSSGGLIEYFTTGTAPNRRCIINYINVPRYGCSTCLLNVQVQLHEGSDAIEIHNTEVDGNVPSSPMTQGIKNSNGLLGAAVPGRNAAIWSTTNDAYRFSKTALPGSFVVNWQSPLGTPVASGANSTVVPARPTTYYAIVSDPTGTCADTTSIFVDVAYVDAGPDMTIFAGDTANINATYVGPPAIVDCNAYTVTPVPYAWISGGNTLSIATNGVSSPVSIGFPFEFYCNTYTSLRVAEDGWLSFNAVLGDNSNNPIPNVSAPNALIAVAWDNLKQRNFTQITYLRTGTAPNRKLVITYNEIVHYTLVGGNNRIFAQVVLYEGSNAIEIHNQRVDNDGGTMTQGIENHNGLFGLPAPGRNQTSWSVSSSSPNAWRFTPPSGGLQYNWTPGATLHNSSIEDPRAGPMLATQYVLTVDNGVCLLRDSMWVFVTPLPVTLMDFRGEQQGSGVLLEWETLEEYNLDYFLLERSRDGMVFEEIHREVAAGTSDEFHPYEYLDLDPYDRINYYRLKMVDLDGQAQYSERIEIQLDVPDKPELLSVYPNPGNGTFFFDIFATRSTQADFHLFATDGRLVRQDTWEISQSGRNKQAILLGELPAGVYIYRITIDDLHFDGKISLIK